MRNLLTITRIQGGVNECYPPRVVLFSLVDFVELPLATFQGKLGVASGGERIARAVGDLLQGVRDPRKVHRFNEDG